MNFPQLTNNIQQTHDLLQNNAMRAINQNITARNWLVGYWIVEFEQNGEDRAKYGERLLSELAKATRIKGMGKSMLNLCRLFYKKYPGVGLEVVKYLLANRNQEIIQSLTGKFRHGTTEYVCGLLPRQDDGRGRQRPDWHPALHRCFVRHGALCHGGHGREPVCLQILAPTALKRNIC